MEKNTKEYNVYEFSELSEEIKNDLIEKEADRQFESYCEYFLEEDMRYEAERLLEKYFGKKAELKNVYYSLSYCQGDGAMIEFNLYYYGKYVEVRQYGHYYHELSFQINSYDLTDKQYDQLHEKIVKMNGELAEYGWKLVDTSNYVNDNIDYIMEVLEENKYLENGEVFYE